MNENHRELLSILLTLCIVVLAAFVIHRFIGSLVWAAVITIASYPLYRRWQRLFGEYSNISAFLFTTIMALILFIPMLWLVTLLVKEVQYFVNYLLNINRHGARVPSVIQVIPWAGDYLSRYWHASFGEPGGIKLLLSQMHLSLSPASHYLKLFGLSLAHRSVQLGFTFLCLFFFYRDGHLLAEQIEHVGVYCLGERWHRFSKQLPDTLRATVNGTIVVSLGVGLLMGACYALVGISAPVLMGFLTAIAAMVPFGAPVIFVTVACYVLGTAGILLSILIVVWGTIVMFVADHFVKPVLIGNAIRLPFLAVLFGILGGVETLGLLGLFVGPIVMVLFMTLWREPQCQ